MILSIKFLAETVFLLIFICLIMLCLIIPRRTHIRLYTLSKYYLFSLILSQTFAELMKCTLVQLNRLVFLMSFVSCSFELHILWLPFRSIHRVSAWINSTKLVLPSLLKQHVETCNDKIVTKIYFKIVTKIYFPENQEYILKL